MVVEMVYPIARSLRHVSSFNLSLAWYVWYTVGLRLFCLFDFVKFCIIVLGEFTHILNLLSLVAWYGSKLDSTRQPLLTELHPSWKACLLGPLTSMQPLERDIHVHLKRFIDLLAGPFYLARHESLQLSHDC
jgi:hypothetical protein